MIDINKLTNGTVYMIAKDLGCEIEYPKTRWGKYTPGYMRTLTEEEYQKLIKSEEYKQEQEKLDKQHKKDIAEFYNNIEDWLINNGYFRGE